MQFLNLVIAKEAQEDPVSRALNLFGLSEQAYYVLELPGHVDLEVAFQVLWEPTDIGNKFEFSIELLSEDGGRSIPLTPVTPTASDQSTPLGYLEWFHVPIQLGVANEGHFPIQVHDSSGKVLSSTMASVRKLAS
ncbi:hypothetical protein [Paenarthrobacter nitroguajacolicus]|uniref:hypothetical protein n=1 Tax=Paenarthrobacter nitroguajacolicus TaxID=211146 RepID=UPI000B216EA0|nr:hypothetical protein [Paenarthrobacter nitroguajacolicus]